MQSLVIFGLALVSIGVEAVLAGSGNIESAYLVKPRYIDSTTEALSILRRFVPAKQDFDEKCQRYAVLLKRMSKANPDQFSIAELGLIKSSIISQQYRQIDVEDLRQLYMKAISESLKGHIDLSMIELVDCLIRKFRSHDAKARSFLNGEELRQTVEQYKNIMAQPMTLLTDPNSKYQTLSVDQLQPAMKRTLMDLFNQDFSQLAARFPVAQVASTSQATPAVSAFAEARGGNVHQVEAKVPLVTAPYMEPSAASQSSSSSSSSSPSAPAPNTLELSKEEIEYLTRLIESLKKLYHSLPIHSNLNNRCEAYSKVISADPMALNEQLVSDVVQQTAEQMEFMAHNPKQSAQAVKRFMPQKDTRENFLVALNSFLPEQRDSTWIDMIDCVSEWEKDDEDVRTYLNSPELTSVIEEMLKQIDGGKHE